MATAGGNSKGGAGQCLPATPTVAPQQQQQQPHSGSSAGPSHSHFTRSQIRDFKAAGVLPFAFCEGCAWVLVGAELARTGPGGKLRKHMCEYTAPLACTLHYFVNVVQGERLV